jgi:hypothetical protein
VIAERILGLPRDPLVSSAPRLPVLAEGSHEQDAHRPPPQAGEAHVVPSEEYRTRLGNLISVAAEVFRTRSYDAATPTAHA